MINWQAAGKTALQVIVFTLSMTLIIFIANWKPVIIVGSFIGAFISALIVILYEHNVKYMEKE